MSDNSFDYGHGLDLNDPAVLRRIREEAQTGAWLAMAELKGELTGEQCLHFVKYLLQNYFGVGRGRSAGA